MFRFRRFWLTVVLATIAMAGPTQRADAFEIRITQTAGPSGPVGPIIVMDNFPGDADLLFGTIVTLQSGFGDFNIQVAVGTSNRLTGLGGAPDIAALDLVSVSARNLSGGTATLVIELSDSNFTVPGAAPTPQFLNSAPGGAWINSAAGDSITFQSFADPGNTLFGTAVAGAPLVATSPGDIVSPAIFTPLADATAWTRSSAQYSLTSRLTIVASPGSQVSATGTTGNALTPIVIPSGGAVPAPSALVLFMSGLPVLGISLIRRRAKGACPGFPPEGE